MWWPIRNLRRAVWKALSHDVLTLSKSAAYSAILGLFPALLVVTTLLALLPESDSLTGEMRGAIADLLPGNMIDAIHAYFQMRHVRSVQAILSALLVSLFGNMGVMTSFMEGFRRAYGLEKHDWSFWRERLVALGLIPSCMAPLAFATLIVAFGHQIESWIAEHAYFHTVRTYVPILWRATRWTIALTTTVAVLAVIYHFGVARSQGWRRVLPGAMGAAALWFVVTLSYGWYVTRLADYTVVYGPFGTAIATLVWLYLTSFSVFIGAELNAQVYPITAHGTVTPVVLRAAFASGVAVEHGEANSMEEELTLPGASHSG